MASELIWSSWWINPMFAYHAGIIDSGDPSERTISDKHGAYALLLSGSEVTEGGDARRFTYHAKTEDTGKYRLTAATPGSRQPVRVLRSHTSRSFCAPRAGIRYDGLLVPTLMLRTPDF